MIYRKFKLSKAVILRLSGEDKRILKILEDVVKDVAQLYEQQLSDGFYPSGVSRDQIEKSSRKNATLLSPFTYVSLENKELKAVPFHQKYASYLQPIAQKIETAAKISSNHSFRNYLRARAKSLISGDYKTADIVWFSVRNSSIDFSVGPFERYLDKLFFRKRIFQAHVGVVDQELTEKANQIKETLFISAKISHNKHHSTNIPRKGVNVFVEETPSTSGYMADVLFSGEHFPSDLEIMQQYGSKILIYEPQLKEKFERVHYPIFKSIFEKRFASKYSKELLFKATAWNVLLYELGRQLHKFIGARERLSEFYGPIDEANGFASGIQHAKNLVVKGLISQDELEAIIIIHIVWMFADWLLYKNGKAMESYVYGNAIDLHYYLVSGALKEQRGISWPNFSKIFFEIEALAEILVGLLEKGSYQEAKEFVEKNAQLDNFERLAKNLKNIKLTL